MYPRRYILEDNSLAHVYFRCHNKSYLLEPHEIKNQLLFLMAKYKRKYGVKIFEFIIMDNHAHFIMRAGTVENLGNFMRTVNSQLAREINKFFNRDSQAIRERFKSPLITSTHYLVEAIQYIFVNRYKVNRKRRPDKDRYCSAFWRIHKPYRVVDNPTNEAEKRGDLLANLLDDPKELGIGVGEGEREFAIKIIAKALRKVDELLDSVFENGHTISDPETVKYRGARLAALCSKKGRAPP